MASRQGITGQDLKIRDQDTEPGEQIVWLREKQETRNKIETCGKPERALAKGWVWGGEAEQTDSWLMEAERPGPEELREGGCMAKGLRSGNLRLRGRWEPVALGRKPGPDAADGTPEERHRRRGDAEGPGGKRRLRLLPRLRSPRSSLRFRSWCRGLEAALAFTLARCTPPSRAGCAAGRRCSAQARDLLSLATTRFREKSEPTLSVLSGLRLLHCLLPVPAAGAVL